MTSNTSTIVAGLGAALITGLISLYIWWLQHRSPTRQKRVRDAWQQQARELAEQLRIANASRITYLEAQVEDLQRDLRKSREPKPRRRPGGADEQ